MYSVRAPTKGLDGNSTLPQCFHPVAPNGIVVLQMTLISAGVYSAATQTTRPFLTYDRQKKRWTGNTTLMTTTTAQV